MNLKILSFLFVILAIVFAALWLSEKNKNKGFSLTPEKFKALDSLGQKNLSDIVLEEFIRKGRVKYAAATEPIDKDEAPKWAANYKASSMYASLNRKEGEYHDITQLNYYIQEWIKQGVDRVDFRYARYPSDYVYVAKRNMFTILLHPQKNKVDLPGDNSKKETLPLNLGDLHP